MCIRFWFDSKCYFWFMKYKSLLLFIVVSFSIYSQKKITNQELFWGRVMLKYSGFNHWNFRQEIEDRVFVTPFRHHHLLIRSHVSKKFDENWSTAIGFTYFIQSLPNNPYIKNYTNNIELRPQFEFVYTSRIKESNFYFQHRNWFEFRYFQQNDKTYKYENLRYRYLFELKYEISDKWKLKTCNEIFLNVGKNIVYNVFDHNRFGFGFDYKFNEKWRTELLYLNWFQQDSSGIDFYNRNIIRWTIFWLLKKKEENK